MPRLDLDAHLQETQAFRARIVAAGVFAVTLIGVLAFRLAYLQVVEYELHATRSDENRLKIIPVPPTRGLIFDRNGVLLAENRPSYTLEITPEQVRDMEATLAALHDLVTIDAADLQRFHRMRRRKPGFEGIPLKVQLTDEEVARVAVNRHRLGGVDVTSRLNRHYPLGEALVHVVGYVGRIDEDELKRLENPGDYAGASHYGKVGVELAYEDALHGSVGLRRVEINAQGRVVRVIEDAPSVPGQTLYLSVDSRLQQTALEALGDRNGAVVAMDPRNGDVLAMVSKPGFDPNRFVNGIDAPGYRRLRNDRGRPLFNRALRGQYPPGSTLKPFFGLASLEDGVNTAERTMFAGPYFQLPGQDHKYRDWKKTGHGWVDLDKAIVQSCDVYFYDLAVKMGIDRMNAHMRRFGLGEPTGLDIRGEVGGLFPSRAWKRRVKGQIWYPGETVITGIGQGYVLATPLQLANAAAILANQGRGFRPRVVYAVGDPAGGEAEEQPPRLRPAVPVVDSAHWDGVIRSMMRVVHAPNGTAQNIGEGLDFKIAGKTGTAQVFSIKQEEEYDEEKIAHRLRDHALFIAFAPVEAPVIAVAVVVENGGSGGGVAAPVARALLDRYFADAGRSRS